VDLKYLDSLIGCVWLEIRQKALYFDERALDLGK